jgi:hypothetical protein
MEHVCSASFEVEGVLRFIKDLLVFLHIEWLLFDEDCAFDTEGVNEIANFLARANESSDFADPGWILFAGVNGQLNGSHVAIRDPVEAIQVVQQAPFYLLNRSGVVEFLLDHLEPSAWKDPYRLRATSSNKSDILPVAI